VEEALKYDTITVAGGDGTVAWVVEHLMRTKRKDKLPPPITIFPFGTGNAIAQELRISRKLKKAIKQHTRYSTEPRTVDLMRVKDKYYFLHVDIGLGAEAVKQLDGSKLKKVFGVAGYVISGVKALHAHSPHRFKITADDGDPLLITASEVVVANSSSTGLGKGHSWGPGIKVREG